MNPRLTPAAQCYALQQLAQRAGLTGEINAAQLVDLQIPVYYAPAEQVQTASPALIIVPCRDSAWQELQRRPAASLDWLPPERYLPPGWPNTKRAALPVLFWGADYEDGSRPFATRRADGSVIFYADILAATVLMLSRWEEWQQAQTDEHGRFPGQASLAYRQGFLDRPIVDEYALVLRAWLQLLRPAWQPTPGRFTVQLSHDIDFLVRFKSPLPVLKNLAGDLLKRRSARLARQTCQDAWYSLREPAKNSYAQNILELATQARRRAFKSSFFFLATEPADPFFHSGYDPNAPPLPGILAALQKLDVQIGLHASYATWQDPLQLAKERACLQTATGLSQMGGRQHYLRFKAPETWRAYVKAGLSYDASLGFADIEGFRCGTCHPFRVFDLQADQELPLQEQPLIVMDGTLFQYRKLSNAQALARIQLLAERCRQAEGTFSFLWHNTSFTGPWAAQRTVYLRALDWLAQLFREE
ncbi:MAG: polysaccharide deacetylase family protein [Anaerolineales bacterium]|nr:polysaccharide deacetylase family protein [Anaerolineales bacterium]